MTHRSPQPADHTCHECGYSLDSLPTCPECGWTPGSPVSAPRRWAALVYYFACLIPLVEALALIAWSVQWVLVPPSSRNTTVTAIGLSVVGVITTSILTNLARYNDRVFARLRWVCFTLAAVIGAGLGVLAVIRPGAHEVLLYALALLNAILAIALMHYADARVSVLEPDSDGPADRDA